jgi:CRP-like cAMP-binding protein
MASPSGEDLRQVQLFRAMSDDDLAELARWFEVRDLVSGDVLTREGSFGYDFMVLGAASAVVTHDDEVVRSLVPGDFLGAAAILGKGRRTATVTIDRPGSVWVLFGARFRERGCGSPN